MKKTGVWYKGNFFTYDDNSLISDSFDELKNDGFTKKAIIKRAYDNVNRGSSDDRSYHKALIEFIFDEESFVTFASGVQTFFPTYDRVNFNEIINEKYLYNTSSVTEGAKGFTGLLAIVIVVTFIFGLAFSGSLFTVLAIMAGEFVVLTPAIIWFLAASERNNLTDTIARTYKAGFNASKKNVEFYTEAAKEVEASYDRIKKNQVIPLSSEMSITPDLSDAEIKALAEYIELLTQIDRELKARGIDVTKEDLPDTPDPGV